MSVTQQAFNLEFVVYGPAEPQGSTRSFIPKNASRSVITSANKKLKPWRQDVAVRAIEARNRTGFQPIWEGPVCIYVGFVFAKPKSTPKRVTHKTTKPDIDKCCRGLLDALSGIAFRDDAQVVKLVCSKEFGSPARTEVSISQFAEEFLKEGVA